MGGQFAWVTLATNDSYSLGALVLAHSLRRAGTKHDLAVLITPGVTQVMRDKLATVFNLVKEVNVLDSKDEANLALLARPELGITFTKLHCWRLTEYEKCVFVDADALVIRNCDELFEREELTAAPDVGWPDCFNSGVFVFKPSQQTFASITAFAADKGSFDGGDQGLLNSYFSDWAHKDISKHLPFIYNMCSTATYSYLPAYKQFGENVRIIHFIGATKPWLQYFDTETGIVHPPPGCSHLQPLLQIWWNIFCDNVHPQLSPVMARSTLAPIWHRFTPSFSATTSATSHAPIYDDSSHSFHNSYSYRSEICNVHQNEPPANDYIEYTNKPADFSEFHDPWDEYVETQSLSSQSYQNQQSLDNCLYYQNQLDFSSSSSLPSSKQYYDIISTNYNDSEKIYSQENQFKSNYDKESYNVIVNDHRVNSEEKIYENSNKNYWRTDNSCSDQKSDLDNRSELIGEKENRQFHHNYCNVNNNYDQTVNEVLVHRMTTTTTTTTSHHLTGNDNWEIIIDNIGADKLNNEGRNHNISQDFIQGSDIIFNDHETEAREQSKISQSYTPCPELTCTAHHPTQMHDLVQHNEHSVENQGHLAIDDAGIAGALAKMTLGEPRSAEQLALEEHMRRQGWEQGQIDYMGRDSFENIWKQICNTLSQAPSRQTSPPRDTEEVVFESPIAPVSAAKTESTEIPAEAARTTEESSSLIPAENEPSVTPIDIVDDAKPTESEPSATVQDPQFKHEAEVKPSELETEVELEKSSVEKSGAPEEIPATETETEIKPETEIEKETTSAKELITTLSKEETIEPVPTPAPVSTQLETSAGSVEEAPPKLASDEPEVVAKFVSTYEVPPVQEKVPESIAAPEVKDIVPPVAAQLPADLPAELTAESVISPITTTEASIESPELILDSSSVPIQVAESVLQSEPKESVSVEQSPVSEEVVSSIVAPVFESATAVSETVAEPRENKKEEVKKVQEKEEQYQNGSDEVDAVVTTAPAISTQLSTPAAVLPEPTPEPVVLPEPTPEPVVLPKPTPEPAVLPEPTPEPAVLPEPTPEPAVLPEPAPEPAVLPEPTPEPALVATEPPTSKEEVIAEPESPVPIEEAEVESLVSGEEPSESSKSASLTPPDSPSTVCPVRPARTRDPRIPTTPVVTEATPPNSPPIGAGSSLEEQPKTVKKVVRKVVVKKAPVEGENTESVEGETPGKKVVKKVVKKIVKKPKESAEDGAEASGAVEKPKKVVKVIKKIVKPTESLNVDASVPETPPAGTSAPVPPKRKTKTTTTTTTTTKITKTPRADDNKPSESEP